MDRSGTSRVRNECKSTKTNQSKLAVVLKGTNTIDLRKDYGGKQAAFPKISDTVLTPILSFLVDGVNGVNGANQRTLASLEILLTTSLPINALAHLPLSDLFPSSLPLLNGHVSFRSGKRENRLSTAHNNWATSSKYFNITSFYFKSSAFY